MRVIGKCPPDLEELRAAADDGFEAVELHLPRRYLADPTAISDAVADSPVEVASVHTPHVTADEFGLIERTDDLASALDAYLVVHSQYLQPMHVPELAALDLSRFGFENNPGTSVRHLEATVLDRGHDLVLDTAHLYMAHADYVARTESLLETHGDAIRVVHLTDSTPTADGVPFGEGEMDMAALTRVLRARFDGDVVLEVMPEHQRSALRAVERY
ncbi:sugar phosphate isomerase/epimerase family protein [Halorarum halobium]|uniref:sugar phosphate isomerase/epimerase family protein n=1 Tax=Halorarum halobium TaxID=3075121 RepID=UPI0028AD11B6|nr:TIM barrel protein [Halobaculum sp. XH14]